MCCRDGDELRQEAVGGGLLGREEDEGHRLLTSEAPLVDGRDISRVDDSIAVDAL